MRTTLIVVGFDNSLCLSFVCVSTYLERVGIIPTTVYQNYNCHPYHLYMWWFTHYTHPTANHIISKGMREMNDNAGHAFKSSSESFKIPTFRARFDSMCVMCDTLGGFCAMTQLGRSRQVWLLVFFLSLLYYVNIYVQLKKKVDLGVPIKSGCNPRYY